MENLIGRKVRGFEYKTLHFDELREYVGQIGVIDTYSKNNNMFVVNFEHASVYYPADQIEAHLVEEEIPTLSDGVMMLVGNSLDKLKARKVMFTKNNRYYAFFSDAEILLNGYKYAKPIEQTKEEQLTAILGSSEKVSEIMELFNDKN